MCAFLKKGDRERQTVISLPITNGKLIGILLLAEFW